jgi:DNA-binding response OmpR family regulator
LIEDEEKIAEFVVRGLEKAGYLVEHVADGLKGMKQVFQFHYDLVLLDLMLPKLNGLDLLQQIRQDNKGLPVIILSAKGDLSDRLLGFETGADDYMPKPFFVEELVAKIKVIFSRGQPAQALQTLTASHLTLDLVSRKAHWFNSEAVLSQREFSLLQYLMQTPGHIFSRKQILKHVWEIDFDPETNVIEVCVQRIKRKLSRGVEGAESPIEAVRGVGYRVGAPLHT